MLGSIPVSAALGFLLRLIWRFEIPSFKQFLFFEGKFFFGSAVLIGLFNAIKLRDGLLVSVMLCLIIHCALLASSLKSGWFGLGQFLIGVLIVNWLILAIGAEGLPSGDGTGYGMLFGFQLMFVIPVFVLGWISLTLFKL